MPARLDPRWFQVASLAVLLAANLAWFDFGATLPQTLTTLAAALAVQRLVCTRPGVAFDPLSPLITGLSLSLLLRSNDPLIWLAAPSLAIASKPLLRWRGKHLFNPACFAIVALLLSDAGVWVSPGQWGTRLWLAALVVCCGGLVLARARRTGTACVFLGSYALLLALRCLWLGDPWTIPLHQLQSGSLLLFSFFMITDPRSTPDHPAARALFAAAVALLAYHLQFDLQLRPGLFYALACLSLATPLLDHLLPAARFRWHPLPNLQPKEA